MFALQKHLDDYVKIWFVVFVVAYNLEGSYDYLRGLNGKALEFKRAADLAAALTVFVLGGVRIFVFYKSSASSIEHQNL